MKFNINKIFSITFVLILITGFTALPLSVPFCLINHNVEDHHNDSAEELINSTINFSFNSTTVKDNDKCCDDNGVLVFNVETKSCSGSDVHRSIATFPYLNSPDITQENKLSLEFTAIHFSPPWKLTNKLYLNNSILLI